MGASLGQTVGAGAAKIEVRPESCINQLKTLIRSSLCDLDREISSLTEALTTTLSGEIDNKIREPIDCPIDTTSGLGLELGEFNGLIVRANQQLHELRKRVEL